MKSLTPRVVTATSVIYSVVSYELIPNHSSLSAIITSLTWRETGLSLGSIQVLWISKGDVDLKNLVPIAAEVVTNPFYLTSLKRGGNLENLQQAMFCLQNTHNVTLHMGDLGEV